MYQLENPSRIQSGFIEAILDPAPHTVLYLPCERQFGQGKELTHLNLSAALRVFGHAGLSLPPLGRPQAKRRVVYITFCCCIKHSNHLPLKQEKDYLTETSGHSSSLWRPGQELKQE